VVDQFWGGGKEDLTGRMSLTMRCGWSEGNGSGGGVRRWWSMARGAGRLYTAVRCSGRGQNGQREARAGCPRRLSGSGNGSVMGGESGGGRKGAPWWGVGALYSRWRRWTKGGAAVKPGAEKRQREAMGAASR
jgi:hypothetical protein